MTMTDALLVVTRRGVRLVITGDELRAQGKRGAVNDALRQGLAEHKSSIIEALGDGIFPDDTLPDEIVIPVSVPNTIEAIRSCVDAQRMKVVQ
jgi:hypothetical protein